MKKIFFIGLALAMVMLLAVGCSGKGTEKKENTGQAQPSKTASGSAQMPSELRFFSGSSASGGAWYGLSVAINQIFEKNVPGLKTSLIPGGAGGGPISVGEGQSDAGLVNLGPLLDAQEGLPPFEKKYTNLRLVANLYDHVFQIVVLKDSGINSIQDLKGKTVCPGVKGQYSEFWFKQVLQIYGMDPDKDVKISNLGFSDAAEAMKNGQVDAIVSAAPLPLPAVTDLAMARNIKLLPFDKAELATIEKEMNGFTATVYPKDKIPYKGDFTDLDTALMPLSIMVRADLPDDLVYQMTKALAENITDLEHVSSQFKGFDPKSLARDLSPKAVFHPGAEKYYKEKGWL